MRRSVQSVPKWSLAMVQNGGGCHSFEGPALRQA
jgi:hypothetical protein